MEANPYPWLIPNGLFKIVSTAVDVASVAVNRPCFVSDAYYRVRSARATYVTASDSATLQVEVSASGVAAGSGTNQLTATMSLSGDNNTTVTGTVIEPPTQINPGDKVNLIFAGTATNLTYLNVTLMLEQLRKGEF